MKNFNYFFNITLRLSKTDNTKRETDQYRNMYYRGKRIMNLKERTERQINI